MSFSLQALPDRRYSKWFRSNLAISQGCSLAELLRMVLEFYVPKYQNRWHLFYTIVLSKVLRTLTAGIDILQAR